MDFEAFFRDITGDKPFQYQTRLAEMPRDGFPRLLIAPTASGKTAAVVTAWLWRRFLHPDEQVRQETPRRLVYCLPSRVLVEQTRSAMDKYVGRFADVAGRVLGRTVKPPSVTTLMGGSGGESRSERDHWLLFPEADQILVGTQDMLLSRALNRGYGSTRFAWPREFGLLNNDALWVFDEVQLMSSGLSTSVQLEAFRRRFGVFGPARSLWLSATLDPAWLATVDHAEPAETEIFRLNATDRVESELAKRLNASKLLRRATPAAPEKKGDLVSYARAIASLVADRHQPQTLSLVVVNTIPRAKAIYSAVKRVYAKVTTRPEVLLLHSHFRAHDRLDRVRAVLSTVPPEGRIVVSTQAIEAGVDISARVLFTELSPWGSMVQRLGRCNRYGKTDHAEAYWLDVGDKASAPYLPAELGEARSNLLGLEDVSGAAAASPDALTRFSIPRPRPTQVLRAPDLVGLFDTTPDLSGFDVDVSRFIRETVDHDLQVFWRNWADDQPPETMQAPRQMECCPAPIGDVRELAKKRVFWRWDQLSGKWVKAKQVYPGQTLLLKAADGGYVPETGWEPASHNSVDEVAPALMAGRKRKGNPRPQSAPSVGGQESLSTDQSSTNASTWVSIADHADLVVEMVLAIVQSLPSSWLTPELERPLLRAARWHDRGKAHPEFQATLLAYAPASDLTKLKATFWAKSPVGRSRHSRRYLRHELGSAMAYLRQANGSEGWPAKTADGQFSAVTDGWLLFDLAAYLIAAHHGRVRLSIRSMPAEEPPQDAPMRRYALGLREGEQLAATDLGAGEVASAVAIDLSVMEIGARPGEPPSWLERTTRLRDAREIGPFRLAFLEAILRAADSRASIVHEKGDGSGG